MRRRPVLAIFVLALVTACSLAPTNDAHDLVVSNQTAIAVTLAVNGVVVRTIQAHSDEVVFVKNLPPQPWLVEARTAGGRVLSSMTVRPGDVWETKSPDGSTQMNGDAVRVDLSCGRLDMWSGPPLLGPPPGPGKPGDCD
ncbi:MAG: hypothetical protein AABM40_10875 [Chloroflexota bacterium]